MDLHAFFAGEVKPALGCTEPVAVALAAAVAARELPGEPERIALKLSINIFKNGRDVGIPGTDGLRGNAVAAALGALAGDPDKGLLVLEGSPPPTRPGPRPWSMPAGWGWRFCPRPRPSSSRAGSRGRAARPWPPSRTATTTSAAWR